MTVPDRPAADPDDCRQPPAASTGQQGRQTRRPASASASKAESLPPEHAPSGIDPAPVPPATPHASGTNSHPPHTAVDPATPTAGAATDTLCRNCDTPLRGPHCHACGQPVKGLVRPLSGWLADFLDTMFSLDGRLWRSIVPLLLRPGHLTLEYLAGRRVRQVTPVRLFLFLIIILLVVVQLSLGLARSQANATLAPLPEDQVRVERVLAWLPAPERNAILHEAMSPVMPSGPGLNIEHPGQAPAPDSFQAPQWLPQWLHGTAEAARDRLHHNLVRISHDRSLLMRQLFQIAPYVLFFMPPLFALLLKLAYLFRRRLYLEHLLVALHGHSVIALGLILTLLLAMLARWQAGTAWVAIVTAALGAALPVWTLIHLLLSQKRIYGQGWTMTVLKFSVLAVLYLILLTAAAVIGVMIGVMSV